MTAKTVNFDPLARGYRGLELLAFGGDLARARFSLVEHLAASRSLLILGEGDGRFLARLLPLAPDARIHCIDSSRAMLARTEARIHAAPGRERVTFDCADLLHVSLHAQRYDAVVTLFFLDCFESAAAAAAVARVSAALQPGATWLYADFSLPERGWARVRARLWLGLLYAFFRWQTGLSTRRLPPAEALIRQAGFVPIAERTLQAGMLRSVLFKRGKAGAG